MADFILYGTEGCHLCEDAEQLMTATGIAFETRDIIHDDLAHQRYAIRIPVLVHQQTEMELNWPFDSAQLQFFIARTH